MTVIAYKDGVIAADSCSFSGGRRYKTMHRKVSRCDLGLIGCAGRSSDCVLLHQWLPGVVPMQPQGMPQQVPAGPPQQGMVA